MGHREASVRSRPHNRGKLQGQVAYQSASNEEHSARFREHAGEARFCLFEVNEVKNLVIKSLVKSYSQLINLKICKQDFPLRSKTSPTLQLQTISHS